MTTFLLFRHGTNEAIGKMLAGRSPGLHLNDAGRAQAERIGERYASAPIRAIYSSPLERALETAAPLAQRLGIPVCTEERLIEVEMGEWTNVPIAELNVDQRFARFNSFRSSTRVPNGELMLEIQARMVTCLEDLRKRHEGDMVALFSHADVIKAVLMVYAGMPLDFTNRVAIYPGSCSVLRLHDSTAELIRLNDTGAAVDF